VRRINEYIEEYKDFVYIFFTRIIDVELPEEKAHKAATAKANGSQTQQVLKYSVNSSLMRIQDLQLIAQILRQQQAVLQFKYIIQIEKKVDWSRFKSSEDTYILFTKLKKDRVVKVPTPEQNEVRALKLVETLT